MVVAVAAAHLYFVLDFCQGGELFFHLRQRGTFPETWCRFYAAQILLALEAMHELSVVYRDLKPARGVCQSSRTAQRLNARFATFGGLCAGTEGWAWAGAW